jgi:hypothetical protein
MSHLSGFVTEKIFFGVFFDLCKGSGVGGADLIDIRVSCLGKKEREKESRKEGGDWGMKSEERGEKSAEYGT